jgi:hypothetical protein
MKSCIDSRTFCSVGLGIEKTRAPEEQQKIEPTGLYLYSELTLKKAETLLNNIKDENVPIGQKLDKKLKDNKAEVQTLTPEKLITYLMQTREATLYAERYACIDGTDWTIREQEILSEVSFVTSNTHAYNNGVHELRDVTHHTHPLPVNFIYASGALLRNDKTGKSIELETLIDENGQVYTEKLYDLYVTRLLPGLIWQNDEARKSGKYLVINIPGIGCGEFCNDKYKDQVRKALPKVLKKIFANYADLLDKVKEVNYDPFDGKCESAILSQKILFITRPYRNVPKHEKSGKLEYPKDKIYNHDFLLIKVVAWDPFSYPGNDIWRGDRSTDDGVSMASSDGWVALINMGQFPKLKSAKISYDRENAKIYLSLPEAIRKKEHENILRSENISLEESVIEDNMFKSINIPDATNTYYEVVENDPYSTAPYNASFKLQVVSTIVTLASAAAIIVAFVFMHAAAPSAVGLIVAGLGVVGGGFGCYGMFKSKNNDNLCLGDTKKVLGHQ